jgi:membrane protease YdiL (CAAX protease family)
VESPAMRRSIKSRFLPIRGAIFLFIAYVLISQLSHTLLFTIIAYLVSLSSKTGTDFSNTVNEISSQYILFATALGASLLSVTIWQADRALYRHIPFWVDGQKKPWHLDRVRKEELWRGMSNGILASLLFLIFFTAAGQISYLGIYITSTMGTPIFPLFFLDLFSLATLLICEEYLFRHKILRALLLRLKPSHAIFITSILHVILRHIQFQLEFFDYVNLLILNLVVGYFFVKSGNIQRGLGFLGALLISLHHLAGLLLWGVESPSFFLFKASSKSSAIFSGGPSGPLGGIGFFLILLAFASGAYVSWKKEKEMQPNARRHS